MHIVVLCGSYDPLPSAVAICAKNVVTALEKNGHKVDVVIPYDGFKSVNNSVHRFKTTENIIYYSGSKFGKLIVRLKRYLRAVIHRTNIRKREIEGFVETLHTIDIHDSVDLLIPFTFPIESILGALKFKNLYKQNVIIKPVIFDNFIDNYKLHRFKLNAKIKRHRHLNIMRSIFKDCDHTYICHSQKDTILKCFQSQMDKITFIEHPLLLKPEADVLSDNNLLYSGTFLKGYVPSKELCGLLAQILPDINLTIDFCVMGDDVRHVENLSHTFKNKVINHGRVSFGTACKLIAEAGILLSVSEINGKQISSKIFSYMSWGKPIIQFYYTDEDINCDILSKYPLAYLFKLRQNGEYTVDEIDNLTNFIQTNIRIVLPFNDVANLYPEACPDYLASLLTTSV